MKLQQRNSMVPFLRLREGEYFLIRLLERGSIDIKGDNRDCITADVYYAGSPETAPTPETIVAALATSPNRALVGANKSFDDLYGYAEDDGVGPDGVAYKKGDLIDDPTGRFFLLHYGGRKEIAGGKKFNMWLIQEIELTSKELEKVVLTDGA